MKQDTITKQPLEDIKSGLKFKSKNFRGIAEVYEVNKGENKLSVFMNSDQPNHQFLDKDWNLQHTIWGFENGEYEIVEPDSKEGLHTQKPNFETLHIGLCSNDEDLQLINELGEHILTIESYPLKENAETIMKVVNERKALLDENKELKQLAKECLFIFGNEANYPEGTRGHQIAQKCRELQ